MTLKRLERHPIAVIAASCMLAAAISAAGYWKSYTDALREGYRAETQRLLQAFSEPVAAAIGKDDDLAKIDELQRLNKLPGVVHAHAGTGTTPATMDAAPLRWQGADVGWLQVGVSKARWRRLRYQALERLWSFIVLAGVAGCLCGAWINKQRKRFLNRLTALFERSRKRRRRAADRQALQKQKNYLAWTSQALAFSASGLILLDDRQNIVAFNPPAQETFNLPPEAAGMHWLDLIRSPEWIVGLRSSLELPGTRIPTPLPGVFLLTPFNDEKAPLSTWIIL